MLVNRAGATQQKARITLGAQELKAEAQFSRSERTGSFRIALSGTFFPLRVDPYNRRTDQETAVSALQSWDDHKPECTDFPGCAARNPGGSPQHGRNPSMAQPQ